jgi:hypothetical protein
MSVVAALMTITSNSSRSNISRRRFEREVGVMKAAAACVW